MAPRGYRHPGSPGRSPPGAARPRPGPGRPVTPSRSASARSRPAGPAGGLPPGRRRRAGERSRHRGAGRRLRRLLLAGAGAEEPRAGASGRRGAAAAAPEEGRAMGARPLGGGEREESPWEAEAAPPPRLPPVSLLRRCAPGGTRGLQ